MKYIRQVMAAGLAIIFLITLVIGTGVIFSIRNVNVSFVDYSGEYEERFTAVKGSLEKLRGSGLLFVSDGDVYDKIDSADSQYLAIESYEKKFPCTVNVVVRERVESFAVKTETGYDVYDEYGKIIRSKEGDAVPVNALDGCPDVLMTVAPERREELAKLCGYFKENFGSLRRMVESVEDARYLELKVAKINLRSGLKIWIQDWGEATEKKVEKAFDNYLKMSDEERISGTLIVG